MDKPNSFAVSGAIALSTEIPPLVDPLFAALQQRNLPTTGLGESVPLERILKGLPI